MRRRCRSVLAAAVVLAAVAPGARARAQGTPSRDTTRDTTRTVRPLRVTGVVHDSLLGAPLAGALVTRAGAPQVALTDSLGRFTLDGVAAGPGAFVFSHPALDSLGLADLVVSADLSLARDSAWVALATPSRATVWARACPAAPPTTDAGAGRGAGILAGVVRDAATGQPVPGVATVAWTAVDTAEGHLVIAPRTRAVRTDGAGAFRVCGVPMATDVEVRGATDQSATGWALATVGPRGLASVDLLVPPVRAGTLGAADSARAVVTVVATGLVRDSSGAPRAGARVTVDGAPGAEATTGADGRFRLAGVPAGTQTLVVRAVGYAPQAVSVGLRTAAPEPVEVTLRRVVRLAEVGVRAARRSPNAWLLDGIGRRRRLGLASVVDSTLISRSVQLRTAFAQVPFTSVRTLQAGTWGLSTMRGCPLLVAVDGRLTQWDEVVDLPPWYVLAIEVYRRMGLVPIELQGIVRQAAGAGQRGCGLAVVWTRAGR